MCKSQIDLVLGDWGLYVVILLLSVTAFGLGRLSVLEEARAPVSITMAPVESNPLGLSPGGLYVASKTGSVYYYPWCAGGQTIAPDAKVWFKTVDDARAGGYAPAKSCKGLE